MDLIDPGQPNVGLLIFAWYTEETAVQLAVVLRGRRGAVQRSHASGHKLAHRVTVQHLGVSACCRLCLIRAVLIRAVHAE